jgi:transcriptional regulator with XRE-family HTH domain
MSQAELGTAAHISTDTIGKYERGTGMPTLKTVCAIAEALACEPNDLFGWTEKEVA